ncbi:hypothetical protein F7725_008283 [Dissostichus mawsoni]|uniref:Uncharacterized protein n=1 Tax=Dissostichus mawsoni TaxID=36200 RepID=A0A7J5Y6W4_DISMA|nr:hypothetical protein F7725_008283 [Dissostichus mawsoni]
MDVQTNIGTTFYSEAPQTAAVWGCSTLHLSVQDDLVLLQLSDDLTDATDHSVHSLRQTLARLRLLQSFLLSSSSSFSRVSSLFWPFSLQHASLNMSISSLCLRLVSLNRLRLHLQLNLLVVFSWSAGDRVSGRNMARDSSSSEVGICCFRCSSNHYRSQIRSSVTPRDLIPLTRQALHDELEAQEVVGPDGLELQEPAESHQLRPGQVVQSQLVLEQFGEFDDLLITGSLPGVPYLQK